MTKETTDHMAMWNRLMPTNPKYTKQFDRGGFKGTATNGTYIVQRLTEEFGPCGQGWRFVIEEEIVRDGHKLKSGDTAKLHVIRGHIEYGPVTMTDLTGQPALHWLSTSPQFGQTMLVGENKYGTFTDEEAPKKSITDCISKCAVLLGIAADVHLGLFDDVKYVNDRKKEEAAESAPAATDEAADPSKHHREPAPQPSKPAAAEPPKPAETAPDTTDDMTIARQVFTLVKATAAKATDAADINDCLKHNAASLKVLERASPVNYETLKGLVADARKRLDDPLNDALPSFV